REPGDRRAEVARGGDEKRREPSLRPSPVFGESAALTLDVYPSNAPPMCPGEKRVPALVQRRVQVAQPPVGPHRPQRDEPRNQRHSATPRQRLMSIAFIMRRRGPSVKRISGDRVELRTRASATGGSAG